MKTCCRSCSFRQRKLHYVFYTSWSKVCPSNIVLASEFAFSFTHNSLVIIFQCMFSFWCIILSLLNSSLRRTSSPCDAWIANINLIIHFIQLITSLPNPATTWNFRLTSIASEEAFSAVITLMFSALLFQSDTVTLISRYQRSTPVQNFQREGAFRACISVRHFLFSHPK